MAIIILPVWATARQDLSPIPFEPQKIGLKPGYLKNTIQFERIQSREEEIDGFDQVIWEISVKNGDKIIFVGFGGGLTWGAVLYEWD